MKYWLVKSEPDCFSIDDLQKNGPQFWDGVRNYQARNFMKDMEIGDLVYFYHSSCKVPAIVGLSKVVVGAKVDQTQFDAASLYYDPKSSPEKPRWEAVTLAFVEKWVKPVSLKLLRESIAELEGFHLVAKMSRLSVMPVLESHADIIESLRYKS